MSPDLATEFIPGTPLTYADALNATLDCVFVQNETGGIVFLNRAAEIEYGYTLEELRGQSPILLTARDELHAPEMARSFVEKALREGSCVFPWRSRRKNGEVLWTEVALRSTAAGGRSWIIAVVRNIELQHRAEDAMRQSEDRLSRVFNSSSNLMAISELETGNIIDVNHTWELMSGINRADAIGRTAVALNVWANEMDRAACREELFKTGRVRDFEVPLITKDGARLFQLSAEVFALGDGRAVLWEFRDIDEQRKLETQLFQAQKLESVGRLAGGVAHDFNNMLGVILGHVELLMMDFAPGDPRRSSLAAVRHAAERSADLTRQLLAFARQQQVTPKVLDVNNAVESMLKMLRRLIGESIELSWRPSATLTPVMMDPVQVDQILANLCVNARDAISGVGTVVIETAQVTVDETMAARHGAAVGNYVRLSISDNGSGIAPDLLPKIFEPFFTTKPIGKGTGLGLATVHGIVMQNRGFIAVESALGVGTTLHVHLPPTTQTLTSAVERHAPPKPVGRGEHVLLVEDEAALLEMMQTMLGMLDFTVIAAPTPHDALAIAANPQTRIDVVISDVIMPQMNGRLLIERIRALRPSVPCLFVSGYTEDVLAEQGVSEELGAVLEKPFSSRTLATKLRALLDH